MEGMSPNLAAVKREPGRRNISTRAYVPFLGIRQVAAA